MSSNNEIEIHEVLRELLRRSSVDPEFRKRALRNGSAVMMELAGKALPHGIEFRFVDNSGGLKTIPLPDPVPKTDELSESELEDVAGGCDMLSCAMTQ